MFSSNTQTTPRSNAAQSGTSITVRMAEDPSPKQMRKLGSLVDKGQLLPALQMGTDLLKTFPNSAVMYKFVGMVCAQTNDIETAVNCYAKSIAINAEDADAYISLGKLSRLQGATQRAVSCFERAIAIDPRSVTAYALMAETLMQSGDHLGAADYFMQVLQLEPANRSALYRLTFALKGIVFNEYVPLAADTFINLIDQTNLVRPEKIVRPAMSLLRVDPAFETACALLDQDEPNDGINNAIEALGSIPLLTKLMCVCVLPSLEIEALLKKVRTSLLLGLSEIEDTDAVVHFCEALAVQCFTNEYVYGKTEEEGKALKKLEERIGNALSQGVQPSRIKIAVLASYEPLHSFTWCASLAEQEGLATLFERQIADRVAQLDIEKTLPRLEPISDEVSVNVRSQYEESPYPRWQNYGKLPEPLSLEALTRVLRLRTAITDPLKSKKPDVLIAGCGTGRTTMETANAVKNSRILAVDLSRASLSYAKQKARASRLQHVEFMQADILKLERLERQFDYIESAGVLHHMQDPMAGWRAIYGCLKAGGLMKIGLYSELSRKHIVTMRHEIETMGLGATPEAITKYREKVLKSEEDHNREITRFDDFFSTSMFRDLVFHVQEHRFTIPQIKKCLEELGLDFCGFEGDPQVAGFKDRFGEDADLYDLDKWHTFETENPSAFIGMYQFWCQKPA